MDQNSVYILLGVLVTVLGGLLANTHRLGRVEGVLNTLKPFIERIDSRIDSLFVLMSSHCDEKKLPSDGTSGTKR